MRRFQIQFEAFIPQEQEYDLYAEGFLEAARQLRAMFPNGRAKIIRVRDVESGETHTPEPAAHLRQRVEALADELMSTPLLLCERAPLVDERRGAKREKSCLQLQTDKPGVNYRKYNTKKMCANCAAAWHVEVAKLILCYGLHDGAAPSKGVK